MNTELVQVILFSLVLFLLSTYLFCVAIQGLKKLKRDKEEEIEVSNYKVLKRTFVIYIIVAIIFLGFACFSFFSEKIHPLILYYNGLAGSLLLGGCVLMYMSMLYRAITNKERSLLQTILVGISGLFLLASFVLAFFIN